MKKIVIVFFALFLPFLFTIETNASYQELPFSNVNVVVTDLEGNIIENYTEKIEPITKLAALTVSMSSVLSYTSFNILGSDIKSTVEVIDDYIGGTYYRTVNLRKYTMTIVSGNSGNYLSLTGIGFPTGGITTDSETKIPVKMTISGYLNESRVVYHHYTIYTDRYNVVPVS